MFQAATQLTPNATKRRNDQLSPHRQPLRQQIINQLSPNAKRPHLDVVLEDEKKSPKPSPKNSPLKNDKVVKSPVKIPESKQPETKSESSNVKNKNENIVDNYILYLLYRAYTYKSMNADDSKTKVLKQKIPFMDTKETIYAAYSKLCEILDLEPSMDVSNNAKNIIDEIIKTFDEHNEKMRTLTFQIPASKVWIDATIYT